MNIDFDKIFTEQNGSFKRPEVIASSLLLIKDIGQAQGIKLSMMEWLKANKKPVSFLPEIKAVHDHAREISEIGTGGEIREEDFLVLTERARVKGLFDKFKKPHYRNYKKSLLKLLNYLGLGDGKVKDINVVKDLEKNGLVPEVISGVEQYINEKGYYFKGQIFSAASAKAKETENIYYLNFYKGEYSCKEKEFFKALSAEQIEFRSEGRFFCLSDIFEGKDGVFPCAQHAEFIVSDSMLDEARKIKHFILQALSNKNSTYSLKDFTVVCSDEESFRTLNNYLYAENIPACSSYKFSGGDINTDVLRLFKAGANGDAQAVLNFFNLYIAQKPLQFKDLTELDLKTLIKKLKNGDNSDYQLKFSDNKKKSRKEKNADENLRRHFIESFLDAALSFDRMMSAKKALTIIKAKLNALKQVMRTVMKDIDTDIFAYEETVNRIFGDTERNFSDYLEYIYIIASKTNTLKLNKDQSGVRLMMMNEASPAGRVLIFSGLTEETFLKASNPVKMMSRDNYFNLYKSIYGKDPEQALYQNLRIITSGQTERAVFMVPEWGEETIPSTRLDKIFEQYPKKRSKIKVIPPGHGPEDLEADFSVSLKDRLMQKGFGKIDITETKPRPERAEFKTELKSKKIEEYLLSPSKLENFMACPASFVHDLNLAYDKIESQFPFTKGNFYHKVTEKFLNSFKGKDLLNDEEYGLCLYELQNGRSVISYSRFTEFADFYLYKLPCVKYISAFETIASKIKSSGIEEYINKELEMQEKNDPYSYYSRVKLRTDVIKFIAWLIIELGPTPSSVTSTFATEVKFLNFEVCTEPRITIKRGYIDLLYRDIKGTVKIIDIKSSAAFDKFEEEIKNYQKVQLLLYREAVSRAIRGETGVDLFAQREDIKQDSDCTILQKEYFDLISADAKIEALYYSPVKPYRLAVADQSYEEFLDRLKKKLGSGTKFEPDACSKCEYCPLSQSCPEYDESKFEQIPGFTPEKDALPQSMIYGALSSKKEISGEEEKKFIMFKKEKAEALVSKENIIVSAGAGAGKTEVLSSKYINLLLNTEAGSENIVCITFTKKAAGEMQKRIYSKITDIIESGYFILTDKGSDPASYRLSESQKQKLNAIKEEFYDKNLISTFHSFCNHFITEYGYFSDQLKEYDAAQDLSEDLTVRTEAVKFLKDQFDTGYRELLSLCLNEDEYKVFDTWLRSRHLIYSNDYKGGFIPDLIDLYEQMKLSGKELTEENWIEPLEKYLNNIRLKIEKEFGSYFSLRKKILDLIEKEADDKLRELGQKITEYKEFSYKRAAKKYPAILDLAEELSLSDGYQIFNKKNVDISLNSEEWAVKKAVFSIIQALDDHLKEFKKQKGLIEQSDLHLHFLEMLKDKELREKFRTGFKYILVDEFQDTNWLQDKILVSLAGKDNKFFLVGDKKQSIFRFQQCDVQIFDKYSDPKNFKTLYFSDNYRSDSRIVEFYNQIFAPDVPNGYNIIREENEFSRPVRTENKFPMPVNFVNISCQKTKKESDLKKNEMNRISKMCEAAFVADTITENIEAGQKYGSWAVLIRKYTHIGYITEAFKKKNIPYTLILKKDLYKLSEVKEYILILKAAAGLISGEEIEFIPGYEILTASVKREDPLASIIFSIAENEVYKNYISGFEDSSIRTLNIEILKETLLTLLERSDNDREKFFAALEKNIRSNSAGVAVKNPGAVTIMTVHSAKGLEFDNLILANVDEHDRQTSRLFNYINLWEQDDNQTCFSAAGYSTPAGSEKRNFFLNEYIRYKNKYFDEQERANLLYVALTRAKNSLTVMIQTGENSNRGSDLDKREGWAKYLKLFGLANGDKIKGFRFLQKDISEFDLSEYYGEDEAEQACTYRAEAEYDMTGHIKPDSFTSATKIAHGQDEVTHEISNTTALDTGNFVHLFMSKKIKELFDADFDLETELKEFKKKESEPSSVKIFDVKKMIDNIRADQLFKKYAECGTVLCEKNIVDSSENLQGYIDLVFLCGDEVIVLDYKTYLYSFPDEEIIRKYKVQINVYADALSSVYPGKTVKKYLFFIGRDKAEMREMTP